MKKTLLLKTLLLLCALIVGSTSAWADEAGFSLKSATTAPIAANANPATTTITGTKSETWDVEIEGTFNSSSMQGSTGARYWQMGKSNNSITSATFSTSGIDGTITKIVVKCASAGGAGGSLSVTVGGDAFGTQNQQMPAWSSNTGGDVTFTGSASGEIIVTETPTATKACYIQSITVTYTPAGEKYDPTITFNNGTVNVDKTLDLSTLFTSNSTGAVTYSITEGGSYATLSGNTLTGVAEGDVTVQASQAAAGSYNAKAVTATITVNPAPALSSIAITTPPTKTTYNEGDLFVATGMVVTATYSDASTNDVTALCTWTPAGALATTDTEVTISYTENEVTKTATQNITVNEYVQPLSVEITPNYEFFGKAAQYSGNAYDEVIGTKDRVTVTDTRNTGSLYANTTSTRLYKDNDLKIDAPAGYLIKAIELTLNTTTHDITSDVGTFTKSTGKWEGSASSVTFSRPSNGSSYVTLSKIKVTLALPSSIATPTFNPAEGTYTTAQNVTINCDTEGTTIYYTTDGSAPTSESTIYTGAITVSETKTIKAIAIKNDEESEIASATYTIYLIEHAGTASNPYTVADARNAIDANTGKTGVYVTGIVSEIVTPYSSTYHNISYNISADGSTTSSQLQAFRGKSYNGDNFTSADDIQVGDIVVVKGDLTVYGTTYELATDNELVSLVRDVEATIPANKEWITFCSPYNLDFTSDIAGLEGAYTITAHENQAIALTATKMTGKVKAGTGLLLRAKTVSATDAQAINIPVAATGDEQADNMLKGVIVDTEVQPTEGTNTNLGLSNGEFHPYSAAGTLAAGKAYLQVPTAQMPTAGNNARLYIVLDSEATGIANVDVNANDNFDNAPMYNLAGQRVTKSYKGVVIVNGKKYINK